MEIDPVLAMEIAALSRQRSLTEAILSGTSDIQKFYAGKTIFLTGGTGFLGKHLIEKLLRSCPDVKRIYVLARPKKDKSGSERIAELVDEPLFNSVKKMYPDMDVEKKMCVMEGDISQPYLGINMQDRQTIADEVNIIFHVAATTRFDEPIKRAVLTNVSAAKEVMLLTATCKNLAACLHVSTAFVQCPYPNYGEKFYPSPVPYTTILDLIQNTDEDRLNRITPSLIYPWPNTYTFTKAIAEDVVRQMSGDLPVAVVRPAIVVASYKEPAPGWLDISSIYGPSAVVLGSGTGVLHTFIAELSNKLELVPVDYVNNACVAVVKETAARFETGDKDTRIYTVSSAKRNPITWQGVTDSLGKCRWMITDKAVWYCFNILSPNKLLHLILAFLWHTIPSNVFDGIAILMGKKPRLRKIYSKVDRLINVLSYFSLNQWEFEDTNTLSLYNKLSKADKEIYNFDIISVNWTEYLKIWYLGIRRYIIKDDLKNTKKGTTKQIYFKMAHYLIVFLYCYIFYKLITLFITFIGWVFF